MKDYTNMAEQVIKAKTVSILEGNVGAILCYLEIDNNSCEVMLNIDNDIAKITDYPLSWRVFDQIVDGTEYSYEEAIEDATIESLFDEIVAIDVYVSRDAEKVILEQLKQSLISQFENENKKEEIINKIDLAISFH